jgi:hypothetical protein
MQIIDTTGFVFLNKTSKKVIHRTNTQPISGKVKVGEKIGASVVVEHGIHRQVLPCVYVTEQRGQVCSVWHKASRSHQERSSLSTDELFVGLVWIYPGNLAGWPRDTRCFRTLITLVTRHVFLLWCGDSSIQDYDDHWKHVVDEWAWFKEEHVRMYVEGRHTWDTVGMWHQAGSVRPSDGHLRWFFCFKCTESDHLVWVSCPLGCRFDRPQRVWVMVKSILRVVYYESIKREIKTRPLYECRCDERLKTKDEESTHLTYTGLKEMNWYRES